MKLNLDIKLLSYFCNIGTEKDKIMQNICVEYLFFTHFSNSKNFNVQKKNFFFFETNFVD